MTIHQFDLTYEPRSPELTGRMLAATKMAVELPFEQITLPNHVVHGLLNAFWDWRDFAVRLQGALTKERELSGELGATIEELHHKLDALAETAEAALKEDGP